MIYPAKKKKPEMIQMAGSNVRSQMEGKERIYSRSDTNKMIKLARKAKSEKDLIELGRFVAEATRMQDMRKPEFVEE